MMTIPSIARVRRPDIVLGVFAIAAAGSQRWQTSLTADSTEYILVESRLAVVLARAVRFNR